MEASRLVSILVAMSHLIIPLGYILGVQGGTRGHKAPPAGRNAGKHGLAISFIGR